MDKILQAFNVWVTFSGYKINTLRRMYRNWTEMESL